MMGKLSSPVRWGAHGKGLQPQYLVGCLPYNLKSVAVSSTDTKNACGAESAGLSNGASETLCDEAGTKEDVWALSQMSLF